jgi:hypothetical protein
LRYQDFAVTFLHKEGDRYQVEVDCSLGEFTGTFEVPPLFQGGRAIGLGGPGTAYRRFRLLEDQAVVAPKELGGALFDALFRGPVLQALDLVRGFSSQSGMRRETQPIRIELRMALDKPLEARLHGLPWELLYDTSNGKFLSLSEQISVVRYLKVPLPSNRPPVPTPLRILLLAAHVPDTPVLDLAAEKKAIEQAWKPSGSARLRVLSRWTLEAFEGELRREPHVIHFMGHADYDETTGKGALLFPAANGHVGRLDGATAAMLLADVPSLRLVVLNACETAKSDPSKPFSGLATGLVRAGVPAVLAMGEPIADCAAVTFSKRLYQELAARKPLDLAVARARKTLAAGPEFHTSAWALPELFLRTRTRLVQATWRRFATLGLTVGLALAMMAVFLGWKLFQTEQSRAVKARVVSCVDFDQRGWPELLGNQQEQWFMTAGELRAQRAEGAAFFTQPPDGPAARVGPYYFGHLATFPDFDPRNNLGQLPRCSAVSPREPRRDEPAESR